MSIRKFLALFLLLSILPVQGGELPKPIQALLLPARGQSEACLGRHQQASDLFRQSVSLGGPVEPLIRSNLVLGKNSVAKEIFEQHKEDLSSTDKKLLQVYFGEEYGKAKRLQLKDAHHSLYLGLVLHRLGQTEEARTHLAEFLSRGGWGVELAEDVMTVDTDSECPMCRASTASCRIENTVVCSDCYGLLRDPIWMDQTVKEPTEKQKQLMSNLTGEKWSGISEELIASNTPFLKERASLLPYRPQATLVEKLSVPAKSLWALAEERYGDGLSVGELGVCLSEGPFDEMLFADPFEQREFLKAMKESTNGESLEWVLNVAYWICRLTPGGTEGIKKRHLLAAVRSSTGLSSVMLGPLASLSSSKMADEQYDYFEQLLVDHPSDLFLRRVLSTESLGFSDTRRREQCLMHKLWLVENCPELAGDHWGAQLNDSHDARLLQAWVSKIEEFPEDVDSLAGAADFFCVRQGDLALALLKRCQQLDPENQRWPREMLFQLSLNSDDEKEWEVIEQVIDAAEPAVSGTLLCVHLMDVFDAEDYSRAKRLAIQLLELSRTDESWNSGNAHHKAHTVLGLLALQSENLELAEHHLLLSGHTKGSPQLKSFGPNMNLAMALLDHKPSWPIVIEFLDLSLGFWESTRPVQWKSQLKAGERPNFGSNLNC